MPKDIMFIGQKVYLGAFYTEVPLFVLNTTEHCEIIIQRSLGKLYRVKYALI